MYNVNTIPREYQFPIINALIKELDEKQYIHGILQAKPGTGKTFMSIYFAQIFKKPLIIVPKDILADQWKSEILNFTDLNENDIGILEGSNIQNIQNILNKKIIIAKVQSLLSQVKRINLNLLSEIYSCIDFIIYDECHGAGAEGYSKTLSVFKTPNILGLTASPFRKGLNEFLLNNSIGDIIIEAEADVLIPTVFIRKLPNEYVEFTDKEKFALKQRLNEYPQALALYNMYISNKFNYLNHIADWVDFAIKENRDTIVLFSTNKLANRQRDLLVQRFPELANDVLVLTGNSKNDALKIAKDENRKIREKLKEYKEELNQKVKNKEIKRKEADELYKLEREKLKELQDLNLKRALDLYYEKIKESKIIISNFGLLREGFDKKTLSFVIFGSPIIGKITVTQTLGRITRLCDDKPNPLALFLLTDGTDVISPRMNIIINNNIKATYPQAIIQNV